MGPRFRIPLRKGYRSLIEAEEGGVGHEEHLEALPLSRLRAAHCIGSAHSGTLEDRCSAQIVNSGEDKDVGGNIAQTWRAGARQTVQALHGTEHRFHWSSPQRDQSIPPRTPTGDFGMMFVGAVHNAILDTEPLQSFPARLQRVGTIAIDGPLIATDQFVGNLALVDARRGDHYTAQQPGALVHPDMGPRSQTASNSEETQTKGGLGPVYNANQLRDLP